MRPNSMQILKPISHAVYICAVITMLAACNGGAGGTVPPQTGGLRQSKLIPAPAKARLYVSSGRAIRVYKLPITAKSTPVATLKTGKGEPTGMAFDPMDRLFVANLSSKIQVFTQPIVDGAVPSFTLATAGSANDVTLDSTGDAVVGESYPRGCPFCFFGYIEVFAAPITSSSTVSYTLNGGYVTVSVAFNPNGNLWTELAQYSSNKPNGMAEYSSPLRKGQRPIKRFKLGHNFGPTGLAFDSAGNLYVPTRTGVAVYQPPRKKLFTIKASVGEGYLAFDASGNLYLTTDNRKLLKFSPPFSASSRPIVTLDLPNSPAGVAIGR
jgi:sugar lactone lactonase YvrE